MWPEQQTLSIILDAKTCSPIGVKTCMIYSARGKHCFSSCKPQHVTSGTAPRSDRACWQMVSVWCCRSDSGATRGSVNTVCFICPLLRRTDLMWSLWVTQRKILHHSGCSKWVLLHENLPLGREVPSKEAFNFLLKSDWDFPSYFCCNIFRKENIDACSHVSAMQRQIYVKIMTAAEGLGRVF